MKGPKIAFNPMPKPELRQLHSNEEKAPYRCLDVKHSVFATRFLGLAFDLPDFGQHALPGDAAESCASIMVKTRRCYLQ